MSHDTIPPPSVGDIESATIAISSIWERHDDSAERVEALIRVMAQQKAELRWLHNIVNKGDV